MQAGELRERVVIQRVTGVSDGQGGLVDTWSTLASGVPAAVRTGMRGSESLQSSAVTALANYEVTLRARADVTPGMRLQWTPAWPVNSLSRTLEIVSTDVTNRDRMICACDEVQAP